MCTHTSNIKNESHETNKNDIDENNASTSSSETIAIENVSLKYKKNKLTCIVGALKSRKSVTQSEDNFGLSFYHQDG